MQIYPRIIAESPTLQQQRQKSWLDAETVPNPKPITILLRRSLEMGKSSSTPESGSLEFQVQSGVKIVLLSCEN